MHSGAHLAEATRAAGPDASRGSTRTESQERVYHQRQSLSFTQHGGCGEKRRKRKDNWRELCGGREGG